MISLVRRGGAPALALLILAIAAGATRMASASDLPAPQMERRLLGSMSSLPEDSIRRLPGMTGEAVARIMNFREEGGTFSSIDQFRSVSGLTDDQYSRLLGHYRNSGLEQEDPSAPAADRAAASKAPPKSLVAERSKPATRGEAAPPPAEDLEHATTGGGLAIEARGNYYSILPGYDLSVLSDLERRAFLEAINTEMCPCGCVGESLGFCLVNDPGCMVVKAKVRKVYKDITGKDPPPKAASAGK